MVEPNEPAWNLGTHFRIVKGECLDSNKYHRDGWYIDASGYRSTIEGTLHYFRSFRNDGRDYMQTFRNSIGFSQGNVGDNI